MWNLSGAPSHCLDSHPGWTIPAELWHTGQFYHFFSNIRKQKSKLAWSMGEKYPQSCDSRGISFHYFWTFGQRSKQLITPGVDNTCRALTHLSVPSLFYQFLQKIMFKLWWSLDGQHLHSCDPLMISWTHLSPISERLALVPHLVRNTMVSNTSAVAP